MSIQPVLVIHGGASSRPIRGPRLTIITASLQATLESVFPKLQKGMSALEAVTWACAALEDDPLYNAGRGSKIQSDGKIRMSASIMDGHRRRFAGCVNVEGLKNPVFLARALLKEKDRVLSGEGARRFARELDLPFASPYTKFQKERFLEKKRGKSGTVGAIALDNKGRMAAATSTGGKGFEYPFRVSDSPTSAGNFATDVCAVSATGTGEEIVEQSAASTICAYVEAGMPLDHAVNKLLERSRKFKAEFGVIAMDGTGHFIASTTTKSIVWAAATKHGLSFLRL